MEELKLILESVENLGTMGAWVFIAYLLKEFIQNIAITLTIMIGVVKLVKFMFKGN